MRTRLVLVLLVALAPPSLAQQPPSIYQRPIEATAVITGSPRLRDGSFQMQGVAALCGEIPKERSLTGEAGFVIEIADPPQGTMTTITFGSKQLVGGRTTASSFRLSVGVASPQVGRPPLYVLNTDPPGTKNTGSATLINAKGVTTLTVAGVNDANEQIQLLATCRPAA
jgi:hypothetical protein